MKKVNFDLEVTVGFRNQESKQTGVANISLGNVCLKQLSYSRDYTESLGKVSLMEKVKAGGIQELDDIEFSTFYQITLKTLDTSNKVKLYNSLKELGTDLVDYEANNLPRVSRDRE